MTSEQRHIDVHATRRHIDGGTTLLKGCEPAEILHSHNPIRFLLLTCPPEMRLVQMYRYLSVHAVFRFKGGVPNLPTHEFW